jgi:hypothetical protein
LIATLAQICFVIEKMYFCIEETNSFQQEDGKQ